MSRNVLPLVPENCDCKSFAIQKLFYMTIFFDRRTIIKPNSVLVVDEIIILLSSMPPPNAFDVLGWYPVSIAGIPYFFMVIYHATHCLLWVNVLLNDCHKMLCARTVTERRWQAGSKRSQVSNSSDTDLCLHWYKAETPLMPYLWTCEFFTSVRCASEIRCDKELPDRIADRMHHHPGHAAHSVPCPPRLSGMQNESVRANEKCTFGLFNFRSFRVEGQSPKYYFIFVKINK